MWLFRNVVARGRRGSIQWAGVPAADLSRWSVSRDEHFKFTLRAEVTRADSFQLRQLPLLFIAPRTATPRGLWCFPVLPKSLRIDGTALVAQLGPPEGR